MSGSGALVAQARRVLRTAADRLVRRQAPEGYWKGEFQTSVIADASDAILRRYLGIAEPDELRSIADTIRRAQGTDGGWRTHHGGPGGLTVSVLSYVALRIAGVPAGADSTRRAAAFIRSAGGVEGVANPAIMAWLCLLGLWPWRDIPLLPPEIMLLPAWFPGNIYQIGAGARGIVVANTLFMSRRPVRPVDFDLRELYADPPGPSGRVARPLRHRVAATVTHWYDRHHLRWLRDRAVTAAQRWLVRRQERDGTWGGNYLETADCLVALETMGHPLGGPVLSAALAGLDRFVVRDGSGRRVEMWTAVVMDTALAVSALSMADQSPADPPAGLGAAADRGAAWLLDREITALGDWAVLTKRPAAGGWSYEFVNDTHPDTDDTSWTVCALRHRDRGSRPEVDAACRRAVGWLLSQQGRDGGWASFEPCRWRLPAKWTLARMGFLEPHSADITGHVLEALAIEGLADHPQARRGVRWLLRRQRRDGSWPGWWACYHVYGTGAAVTGLTACGLPPTHPAIRRACDWLEAHQQPDGGWGEEIWALRDPRRIGSGPSTPSQTSWALLALVAGGRASGGATARGVEYLVRTQRGDGDWDEPWHTWVAIPNHLYWRDTLLRLLYPVTALSAYLAAVDRAAPDTGTVRPPARAAGHRGAGG